MSERTRVALDLNLLAALSLVLTGCDHETQLPMAPGTDRESTAPSLGVEATAEKNFHRDHRRWRHAEVVAEGKDALSALLSGEQVYYQESPAYGWPPTYTDIASAAEAITKLNVNLVEPSRRWRFNVTGASETGFTATARGRAHTQAAGITVTLRYVRRQPLVWRVQRR